MWSIIGLYVVTVTPVRLGQTWTDPVGEPISSTGTHEDTGRLRLQSGP